MESQIGALPEHFGVPPKRRERLLRAWRREESAQVAMVAPRLGTGTKLERLKQLYLGGDLDLPTYRAKRWALAEESAAWPEGGVGISKRAAEQGARPRRLAPEERDVIRTLVMTRSLREPAAEFGSSHETVRSVLCVR